MCRLKLILIKPARVFRTVVNITIKGTSLSTKTDGPTSAGQYGLGLKFEPSVVEFILIAEHDGYEPFETPPIKFDANNFIAVKKDITLQPEPEPEPEPDLVESKVLPIGALQLLLLD